MILPLQITFRNFPSSPYIRARIRERADKLGEFHDRIMSCRVVVESPHRRHHKGKLFMVSIALKVPKGEIAVNREPAEHHAHEDIYVAIRDAFDALQRRLQDLGRRRQGATKAHAPVPHGRVQSLSKKDGYGFIRSAEGEEIYFHRHSVINGGFAKLKVGAEVRFTAEAGDKGLQATTVRPVGKHHPAD